MLVRSSRLPRNQSAGCSDETPLLDRPPKAAEENRAEQSAGHQRQHQSQRSFIVILLFLRIALSSLATQCQAFKQPMTRPTTSSISVQEWLLG